MNQVKAPACKPNKMDYSFEKNAISQCEKKCLAVRDSLQGERGFEYTEAV